jgi:hypothetical protein
VAKILSIPSPISNFSEILHSYKHSTLPYTKQNPPILPEKYKMAQQSLAKDLFEDMGAKVAEASAQEGDDDMKVVDVIESLCMNCHEDVNISQSLCISRLTSCREPHASS